jgi:hypothetical protein
VLVIHGQKNTAATDPHFTNVVNAVRVRGDVAAAISKEFPEKRENAYGALHIN